jgi:hypothetical protein
MGSRIDDINPHQEALLHLLGNRALTSGGIVIHGANAQNVKTVSAVTYIVNGVFYSKAAQTEIAVGSLTFLDENGNTSAVTAQADGKDCIYLLALDASSNIRVIQGEDVATGGTALWPKCPPEHAPFGAVKVANASGSDFTFGTTALSAAGVTDTYYDLSVVPAATSP